MATSFLNSAAIGRSCLTYGVRIKIFYAHPCSSRESGLNENRLIRRFVPKGLDIGVFSEEEIENIICGLIAICVKSLTII